MLCASVTTAFGIQVASHSEKRYQAFASAIPFLAIPLQPVDIQRDRHSQHARDPGEHGVRGVAVQHGVIAARLPARCNVERASVRERIEIFVPDGGQIFQPHAAIGRLRNIFPAVNRDAVTACDQPRGKLFGESLESAIARRDAAGAEDREPHVRGLALAAGGASLGHSPSGRTGCGPADGLIGKPTGNIVVLGLAALHDLVALFHHPPPVARQIPERLERAVFVQNARAHHHQDRAP